MGKQTAAKPKAVFIREPLEAFLKSVEKAYETAFGVEQNARATPALTLYSLPAYWFAPGTVNCLIAPSRLSMPLLLRFILDHADCYSGPDPRASLLVSKIQPVELIIRMAAYYSRIGINRLRRGNLSGADWPRLVRISSRIYERNMFFCHGGGLSATGTIREMLANHSERAEPFGLILVNGYYDDLPDRAPCDKELAESLLELKAIAAEFRVSIVVSCTAGGAETKAAQSPFNNHIDLLMTLHPRGGKFELLVKSSRKGVAEAIPLILIPEVGVMEKG